MLLFLFACCEMSAQVPQEPDTSHIYRKIKEVAQKHKLTRWAYEAIFVDPQPIEYPTQPAKKEGKVINPYLKQEDKVIRHVIIRVYDPFGCSVYDTICKPLPWLERQGNKMHVTTRSWVIANKLLFKEHEKLNPLSLSESERLLRQSGYVNDARIFVTPVKKTDSVDVYVLVQDKWSVTLPAGATPNSADARLRDINLFGLGQQFEQYVQYRAPNHMIFNGFYNLSNIDNTYISSRLSYASSESGTSTSLSFDRPFYSPLATWAGGLAIGYGQNFFDFSDTVEHQPMRVSLHNYSYDIWGGKTFKLQNSSHSIFSQSNNFMFGLRYYSSQYVNRPHVPFNLRSAFSGNAAFIGNIGFALQQYYKDKYIYRFGANEDVPEGLVAQFIYGVEKRELRHPRLYLGAEVARAHHFPFGYFSTTFSYSMFFSHWIANDVSTNFRINYFTDLFPTGRWYLRQFFNLNLLHGENKEASERVTLTAAELYGFNSHGVLGKQKIVVQSETVAYAPYNIIGFKFAPILMVGVGVLGDSKSIYESPLYQGYSLGIMFRNEHLLSSTFQVSFGLYPVQPGGEQFVLRYNPVTSFTLRVRTFAFSKPSFISY